MPITKLLSKQKVDVTMTAILGKGREHTKWVPGFPYYKAEPSIKISGKVANPEQVVKACPLGVLKVKGSSVEVDKDKLYDCSICQQCAELDENIALEETGNFIFSLESWGQLSCKEILNQSADILINKIEELENLI
jgi:DNA-directed RNA polymerase subunit D